MRLYLINPSNPLVTLANIKESRWNRYRIWKPLGLLVVAGLTPLQGTRLWDRMESDGRITANDFPKDWEYYTLTFPVARYQHLSWADMLREMDSCNRMFYSFPRILRRTWGSFWRRRKPLIAMVSNLSYWANERLDRKAYREIDLSRGQSADECAVAGRDSSQKPQPEVL